MSSEHPDPATEQQPPRKHTTLEKSNVFFNGILALVTIILAWIAYQQLMTSGAARRPWIAVMFVDIPGFKVFIDPEHGFATSLPIKNVGGSPAFDVATVSRTRIFKNPPKSGNDWSEHDIPKFRDCFDRARAGGANTIVFPGNPLTTTSEGDNIDASTRAAVFNNEQTIFVVGCALYRDDGKNIHQTEFCVWVEHEKGNLNGKVSFCPFGNKAD
jgi:hypothetical protein